MFRITRFFLAYWRSISIASIIFLLTTFTENKLVNVPDVPIMGSDKIAHFSVFFILTVFLIADIQKRTKFSVQKIIILVIAICFIHGGIIELIQHWFLEFREGCPYDHLANMLGCLTACYFQPKFRLLRC